MENSAEHKPDTSRDMTHTGFDLEAKIPVAYVNALCTCGNDRCMWVGSMELTNYVNPVRNKA
jgi:hypothetical protein